MKKLPCKIWLIAVVLCLSYPISGWAQTTYTYTGTSGGFWNVSGNWSTSGYPGSTTASNDIADINSGTVVDNSNLATTPSNTISQLNFNPADNNELDDQYQFSSITGTPGLVVTSNVTLGGSTGTNILYLDPRSSSAGPVYFSAKGGLTIDANGVLELGTMTNGANDSAQITTGTTQATGIYLNTGGEILVDYSTGTASGGATIGLSGSSGSSAGYFTMDGGTLVVGNYGQNSGTASGLGTTVFINAEADLISGSIVAGTNNPHSPATPTVDFVSSLVEISSAVTLGTNLTYELTVGNTGSTHTFESDAVLPNFTIGQYGTFTDEIGGYEDGLFQTGSLTLEQTHTSATNDNATVELLTNAEITSGGTMPTVNNTGGGSSGVDPINTIDLNGFTLDLTAVGSGTTTFTPNASETNTWVFEGTGTVKAYAFNLSSAYNVTTTDAVTFEATGGAGSSNNLSYNSTSGTNGSLASLTFEYAGNGTTSSPALLGSSNRAIGGLEVQDGVLQLTGGAVSITSVTINNEGTLEQNSTSVSTVGGTPSMTVGGSGGSSDSGTFDLEGEGTTVGALTLGGYGTIQDSGSGATLTASSVTVTNSGNFIGTNVTIAGATTITSGGSLQVTGSIVSPTTTVNGTLQGDGFVQGIVVNSGGNVTPGAAGFTPAETLSSTVNNVLTATSLTLNGGSSLTYNLYSGSVSPPIAEALGGNVINLSGGALTFEGLSSGADALTLDFNSTGTVGFGTLTNGIPAVYDLITDFSSSNLTAAQLNSDLSDGDIVLDDLTSSGMSGTNAIPYADFVIVGSTGDFTLELNVVPEPGAWAMFALGLGFLFFAVRRRRFKNI